MGENIQYKNIINCLFKRKVQNTINAKEIYAMKFDT